MHDDVHRRIRAEFREMPGLTLTLEQASRLFDLEPTRCARVLGQLVEGRALTTDGRALTGVGVGRRYA